LIRAQHTHTHTHTYTHTHSPTQVHTLAEAYREEVADLHEGGHVGGRGRGRRPKKSVDLKVWCWSRLGAVVSHHVREWRQLSGVKRP